MKKILFILIFLLMPLVSANPTPFGYEYLDGGKVVHAWNTELDYYFNATSGLQFTNHYNEYWARNVFCVGHKLGPNWVYDRCNDKLLNFSWTLNTDNLTYVEAIGWKDTTISGYDVRVALRYALNTSFGDLVIQPYIENRDTRNIPVDVGFLWNTTDIKIANNQTDNFLRAAWTYEFNLSQPLNNYTTSLPHPEYMVYKDEKWFRVKWNESLTNWRLGVESNPSQYNAPIIFGINGGKLSSGQNKSTEFLWIDATCSGQWGSTTSFVTANAGSYLNNSFRSFPPAQLDGGLGDPGGDYLKFSDNYTTIPRLRCYTNGISCPSPVTPGCSGAGQSFLECRIWGRNSTIPGDPHFQATDNWNNALWYSIHASTFGQNCEADGGSNYYAQIDNFPLKHEYFTDFRCRVTLRRWEFGCFIEIVQGANRLDNWYADNDTPIAENVSIKFGSGNQTCDYDFLDLDSDGENTTKAQFKWYLQGESLQATNLFHINNTNDYVCCAKVYDDLFNTTNEQYVCSGDLDFNFTGAIIASIAGSSFFLFVMATKISHKHIWIKHLWILTGIMLLWTAIYILAIFANFDLIYGLNNGVLSALIFLLVLLVYWIFYKYVLKSS